MTSQEMIERDLRLMIGDLQVQVIVLRAQLAEQIEQAAEKATSKLNGGVHPPMMKAVDDGVQLSE